MLRSAPVVAGLMADTPGLRKVLLRSAAFRLAGLQAALFAVIVMTLFGITWWTVGGYVEQRVHATAVDELRELTHVLSAAQPAGASSKPELDEGKYFGLFDLDGRHLDGEIGVLPVDSGDQKVRVASAGCCIAAAACGGGSLPDGRRLVVGYDRSRADALLLRLRHAFLLACVMGSGSGTCRRIPDRTTLPAAAWRRSRQWLRR